MEHCGELILETTEEVHSDGSVSLSVIDTNDTGSTEVPKQH